MSWLAWIGCGALCCGWALFLALGIWGRLVAPDNHCDCLRPPDAD